MPNTSLPTGINAGDTGNLAHRSRVHQELNRMTRDTGQVDFSGLLRNGWTLRSGGKALIRRLDNRVILTLAGLDGTNATGASFLSFSSSSGVSLNFAPSADSQTQSLISPLYRPESEDTEPWYFTFFQASLRATTLSGQNVAWIGSTTIEWSWECNRVGFPS